jgi:hypothetical protein
LNIHKNLIHHFIHILIVSPQSSNMSATTPTVSIVAPAKNRYMIFLSANRATITGILSTENPELKGRELMTATTVRAGVMWKALSDAEKDVAIEKANAVIALRPATEPKPKKASKSKTVSTPEELFRSKQAIRRTKELEAFTTKQAEKSQREFAKFTEGVKVLVAD